MKTAVIGYPYIGQNREWKRVTEAFWKEQLTLQCYEQEMKNLRLAQLYQQKALGLDILTVGDFTYYDRMLDMAVMFNMVPSRYDYLSLQHNFTAYFAMARGAENVVACEMTKWFNTNYHYIVPEYEGQQLALQHNVYAQYIQEAIEAFGMSPRVTIIGPFTFYKLTKGVGQEQKQHYIQQLVIVYKELLQSLEASGATTIQLEEPSLTKDLTSEDIALVQHFYHQVLKGLTVETICTSYFEALSDYETMINLPVDGFGLDFVHGKIENIASLKKFTFPKDKVLYAGIINGRDIWRAELQKQLALVAEIRSYVPYSPIHLQTSCSLQHVPVTTAGEKGVVPELQNALAFANEKIKELQMIKGKILQLEGPYQHAILESQKAIRTLAQHKSRRKQAVLDKVNALTQEAFKRADNYNKRSKLQRAFLQLPDYPTTTIGSFPQSAEVKKNRSLWRKGEITTAEYEAFNANETARWIAIQEQLGLDVFVHGEFERTDMVEFFGEKLDGFAFTNNGWVVSYGSRCVKPPIIYGDVEWTEPMTVREVSAAQSLTDKPVKGMLTGPVTILNWSFVRNDLDRSEVAYQIALALREEVYALEKAGINIIQVDEPALKEGLPIRKNQHRAYIESSVNAFKLATSGVRNTTQIHTHMCYCEFNDFIDVIESLDADVISIETSRSHGELVKILKETPYRLGIGLGVYDIHSPRIPTVEEMAVIIGESKEVIEKEQFWINPDCGLKTRTEQETIASLKNMVAAKERLKLLN
ncbi:5-methyltetrahydropteroyltriglutamate--homocysteine S-methyltransferase [Solibacillus isronensis]|uniref:5-methyltetrahydropteroyltriglutamate-- homocysteine S-methyltransferase n=1 Tax=Solibacillus isronensis TaxID=412383 RepID=UPI002559B167|nr:5-methyltetrahydropteroyltriglutamate--homocysteine S-methyltransferase [Solibacillus isronensis]